MARMSQVCFSELQRTLCNVMNDHNTYAMHLCSYVYVWQTEIKYLGVYKTEIKQLQHVIDRDLISLFRVDN